MALPLPPYWHQEKAFNRLLPGPPHNTLMATGPGSGKTECFLLPQLNYFSIPIVEPDSRNDAASA